MKIEIKILSKDESGVDVYLVSGSKTGFRWEDAFSSSSDTAVAVPGKFIEKKLPAPVISREDRKLALGAGKTLRSLVGAKTYFQTVRGDALTDDAILAEMQHAVLDARQIAADAMSSLSRSGAEWRTIEGNDLDSSFDLELLAKMLGAYSSELGAPASEVEALTGDSPTVRLFAHMLYRTAYGLSTPTILMKPYVQQHEYEPPVRAGMPPKKQGIAWLGETGARDLQSKGAAWDNIAELENGTVEALLAEFKRETRWRERHDLARKDGGELDVNESDVARRMHPRKTKEDLKSDMDRFGASLVRINMDHFSKVLAGTKTTDDKSRPRGESLLWTYMHEMAHSYSAAPDGIYLQVKDDQICYDRAGFPKSTAAERLFAADFMTYFLLRASGDLKSNRYSDSGLQPNVAPAPAASSSDEAAAASSSPAGGLTRPALGWSKGVNGARAAAKGAAVLRGRSGRK